MKKRIGFLSVFILFLFTSTMATAAVNFKEITILLKPITIKTDKIIHITDTIFHENHIYIPLRLAAEALDASVEWDGLTQTVEITPQQDFVDFPEADPWTGERFVYGEIISMDKTNYMITIEEHIDDNSIYLEPDITVERDVVLILQRGQKKMNIDFEDLYVGEYVGIILNSEGKARGIILNS